MGCRFLELDKRSFIHNDICEKKAIKKTSQALQEGQVVICKRRMYNMDEAKEAGSDVEPPNIDHEMSPEGFTKYEYSNGGGTCAIPQGR
jgi:hypothetical protein